MGGYRKIIADGFRYMVGSLVARIVDRRAVIRFGETSCEDKTLNERLNKRGLHNFLEERYHMRLWKMFLIVGVALSVMGCILLPISQIRTEIRRNAEAPMTYRVVRAYGETTFIVLPYDVYPYSWLMLPATVIFTIGIVSIIYGYLVKRAYG